MRAVHDVLVLNAGIWPRRYAETAQGHEIAFGVNVLGHFTLTQRLLRHEAITGAGRVVWLTGDIYILARDCTPDFRYRGTIGGMRAYCRSKLGNLWLWRSFAKHRPDIGWYAAHPGVVATNLGGSHGPDWLTKRLLLTPDEGARTTLLCATAAGPPGYVHNTRGFIELSARDPATDDTRAEGLFATCSDLAEQ